jgi:hypothetical protein
MDMRLLNRRAVALAFVACGSCVALNSSARDVVGRWQVECEGGCRIRSGQTAESPNLAVQVVGWLVPVAGLERRPLLGNAAAGKAVVFEDRVVPRGHRESGLKSRGGAKIKVERKRDRAQVDRPGRIRYTDIPRRGIRGGGSLL